MTEEGKRRYVMLRKIVRLEDLEEESKKKNDFGLPDLLEPVHYPCQEEEEEK